MHSQHKTRCGDSRIDFGYLGCRDVEATEGHLSMTPGSMEIVSEAPILVFPTSGAVWPPGDIDLRGTP
ncbi:hypothetical protein [Microbacterium sp. UFMG61]|uniref:hypothetical protein n=1 Tax=Microbacterium sp. UFMG61 TaxID=2745935 RepID=UPI00188FD06E|nr:hypothetical protein [Microbacterium sp. UFMG61]